MADTMEDRACELAVYIIETGATVRAAARKFGISKSTVHKDLTIRLPQYNRMLYFHSVSSLSVRSMSFSKGG